MFTGLIEEVGKIVNIGGGKLTVEAKTVLGDIKTGDSIAVNGVCLTAASFDSGSFTADVMPETIRRTSFAETKKGSLVNLERALRLCDRLGGHIVSGHIDGTGTILGIRKEGNALLMKVGTPKKLLQGIVEKGSVALDGISLTVAEVSAEDFTVSLIPHTIEATNLRSKKAGSIINIETDILGKYAAKFLMPTEGSMQTQDRKDSGISEEFLISCGFL